MKIMFIKKEQKDLDNVYGPIFHSAIFRKKVFLATLPVRK